MTEPRPAPKPELLPVGPDGLLVRFALTPDPAAMAAAQVLAAALEQDPPEGVTEIAPGLVSVLLRFDPARSPCAALARAVGPLAERIAAEPPATPAPLRRWKIPVAFGDAAGPQLAETAALAEVSPERAVREICEADLRVLVIGFAPGQPYIGLLPDRWNIPRQSALTPRVPAGAIVLAVRQIVLFGAESATGWRQIGQSGFRTFLPERDPPMLLRAGDAIRFAPVPQSEMEALSASPDGRGGARLEALG